MKELEPHTASGFTYLGLMILILPLSVCKAAMVSNLLVVLCGERAAQPVLNTGTMYH